MAPPADEPERDVRADAHPAPDSEDKLLRRVAARDPEAFDILYRRYARSVYGLALRTLRDRARSEDATLQAFAAIWRSAATFVPEGGRGAPWLFAVARNAIVAHGRAAGRAAGPEVAEDDWVAFRVHAAVAELPEPERVPLELA